MKIGFVTPWFGLNIPGGAEAELKGLVFHLQSAGTELEILTTCVEKFGSDWNCNFYPEGKTEEEGLTVRRFPVRERNTGAFNDVNWKLMHNMLPLSEEEEEIFVRESVNSTALYSYMKEQQKNYDLFVFIPYMFGTTYYGMQVCPEKSVLIPCLHDESYIYLKVFRELFPKIKGMIFHAGPEKKLAGRVYDLSRVDARVLGEGVYTDFTAVPDRFQKKYQIEEPFILYAGRKDAGKNVDVLIRYFSEYHRRHLQKLKLILIGGGEISIPASDKGDIIDLGFVPIQDKYDAYGAAELLCQPSSHESFSLVVMESWLCGRPVLVSEKCEVTKNFAVEAGGGLFFSDYREFEAALDYLFAHRNEEKQMGENGKQFVMSHFSWEVIVSVYQEYFRQLIRS